MNFRDTGVTYLSVADLRKKYCGDPLEMMNQFVDSLGNEAANAVVSNMNLIQLFNDRIFVNRFFILFHTPVFLDAFGRLVYIGY